MKLLRRCSWTRYSVNTSSFAEAKMFTIDHSIEARNQPFGSSSISLTVEAVATTSMNLHGVYQQSCFIECTFN